MGTPRPHVSFRTVSTVCISTGLFLPPNQGPASSCCSSMNRATSPKSPHSAHRNEWKSTTRTCMRGVTAERHILRLPGAIAASHSPENRV